VELLTLGKTAFRQDLAIHSYQAPLTRLGEYTQLARRYGFNVSSTISILLLAD